MKTLFDFGIRTTTQLPTPITDHERKFTCSALTECTERSSEAHCVDQGLTINEQKTLSKPKSYTHRETNSKLRQMCLDVGQSNLGVSTCNTCGMVYTAGDKEDDALHRKLCNTVDQFPAARIRKICTLAPLEIAPALVFGYVSPSYYTSLSVRQICEIVFAGCSGSGLKERNSELILAIKGKRSRNKETKNGTGELSSTSHRIALCMKLSNGSTTSNKDKDLGTFLNSTLSKVSEHSLLPQSSSKVKESYMLVGFLSLELLTDTDIPYLARINHEWMNPKLISKQREVREGLLHTLRLHSMYGYIMKPDDISST